MQESEKPLLNENPNEILYINFNQDGTCIAVGTETGFKIINISPFLDLYYKDLNGGIGIIEMLYKTNILALVGGGKNPKFKLNELIIWDEEKDAQICKITTKYKILNTKIRENKIFIANKSQILVFDFNTLNLIETLETKNIRGLISLCYKEDIVAYPDIQHEGTVKIKNYDTNKEDTLKAHKTPLNCIQLNQDGTMIGTCSLKGTLIRVYNIANKQLIREVRRGAESANVNCISFDISQKYFIVVSDRKTIHLFFLINNNSTNNITNNSENQISSDIEKTESVDKIEKIEVEEVNNNNGNNNNSINNINNEENKNRKSIFEGMSNFLGVGKRYFGSEWSFARMKINISKSIAIFKPDNCIIIVTYEGKFYQASFDPINGGECIKIQEEKF
jgi:WD40 repeat protein